MKRLLIFVLILMLVVPTVVSAAPAEGVQSVKIPNGPKFRISNVERGESVTLAIQEFPAGKSYQVYLAVAGDHYSDGWKVGTLSDTRENFRVTYSIPQQLAHQAYISVFIVNLSDATHGYDILANDTGYDWREPLALTPVHRSSAQSAGKSVGIFQGPTYWVEENGYPNQFVLRFWDFYEAGSYTVFVGENSGAFESYIAGYAAQTDGIYFQKTFDLPAALRVQGKEIKVVVQNSFNGHSGSVAFRYQDPYIHQHSQCRREWGGDLTDIQLPARQGLPGDDGPDGYSWDRRICGRDTEFWGRRFVHCHLSNPYSAVWEQYDLDPIGEYNLWSFCI
jgi:hypothetical protein